MKKWFFIGLLCMYPLFGQLDTRAMLLSFFAGEWVARGLYVAAKLEIADILQEGPKQIEDMAKITSSDKEALYRVMHMLSSAGIFEEEEGEVFKNNALSAHLSKTHPNSLHHLSLFYGEEIHMALGQLLESTKTGQPIFDKVFKEPVFPYFQHHVDRGALFQKAMLEKSRGVIDAVLTSYNFSKFNTICDVGGGYGQFLTRVCQRYPHLTGVLYDLPSVIQKVREDKLFDHGHNALIAGDFFEAVPEGKDVYILKSVLHDWDDVSSEKILQNCHRAMNKESRLLIVEAVIQPKDASFYANCMDMVMLAVTGGKERNLRSFIEIFDRSGFTLEKIYPTSTEFSILVLCKKSF